MRRQEVGMLRTKTVLAFCHEVALGWRKTQVVNLANAVMALLERKTLVLSHLAQQLPRSNRIGSRQARHPLWHQLKRLRRFLSNPRLKIEALFRSFTALSLTVSDEPGLRLPVLLDITYMAGYSFLVGSVPKHGRALPIAWDAFRRDLAGEQHTSQNIIVDDLVRTAFCNVPETVEAVLVADREFARASLFRFIKRLKRHFVIRVDSQTWIRHADYNGALGDMGLRPGDEPRWLPGALYGKTEQEPVSILAIWQQGYDEPWLLATNLTDAEAVFPLYHQRMKIEHGFRDWKHHLRLKGTLIAKRVDLVKGLMTVMAVLYWLIALFGLRWTSRQFWSQVACWGQPSFFKTAIDLLMLKGNHVSTTWRCLRKWLSQQLDALQPPRPTHLLRYRRNRRWLAQSG
jgi:hypothetical protein